MRDRVYMFLAFVGFIIIAVICVLNYDGAQEVKEFGPGTYYTPTARYGMTSSSSIYNQMINRKSIACPESQLTATNQQLVTLNGIAGSKHPFQIECLFVTWDALPKSKVTLTRSNFLRDVGWVDCADAPDAAGAVNGTSSAGIPLKYLCPTGFGRSDMVDEQDMEYIAIIAPFSFAFENTNTSLENGGDIVIVNNGGSRKGKCRITFKNVANWFCAGTPGTQMEVHDGKGLGEYKWIEHSKYHQTIIGNSKNAELSTGSSGTVIGYANDETTIIIEVYDGSWKQVTIYDWITGSV